MSLKKISTDELRAELSRREEEARQAREEERRKAHEAQIARFEKLSLEMINVFVPEHSHMTCSDEPGNNGFWSDSFLPRCTRCALLELLNYPGTLPEDIDISVEFVSK
jgi:hypothetical protein